MTWQGPNSVTGFNADDYDANSLWNILEGYPSSTKSFLDKIHCGDVILLQHSLTRSHLRSYDSLRGLTSDALQLVHSGKQSPDNRNNWQVVCVNPNNSSDTSSREVWKVGTEFRLRHVLTNKYLRFTNNQMYTEFNCGRGCMIAGQLELHAVEDGTGNDTKLKVVNAMVFQATTAATQ